MVKVLYANIVNCMLTEKFTRKGVGPTLPHQFDQRASLGALFAFCARAESDVRRSLGEFLIVAWWAERLNGIYMCVVCWCCDICQPKYILLLLYMQTLLFGAPQMKPQISCNLKLFRHKKWTRCCCCGWCGLGLRVWRSTAHNEATHTLRVFCREQRAGAKLFSSGGGRQSVLLTGCCAAFQL